MADKGKAVFIKTYQGVDISVGDDGKFRAHVNGKYKVTTTLAGMERLITPALRPGDVIPPVQLVQRSYHPFMRFSLFTAQKVRTFRGDFQVSIGHGTEWQYGSHYLVTTTEQLEKVRDIQRRMQAVQEKYRADCQALEDEADALGLKGASEERFREEVKRLVDSGWEAPANG